MGLQRQRFVLAEILICPCDRGAEKKGEIDEAGK
jgi:hypothetical protein